MMFSEEENSGRGGLGGHANNQPPLAIESPAVYKCSPVTNYDRLISKSLEELAKWMANKVDCQYCSVRSEWCTESDAACKRNWLDWLRQEATDE